MSTKTCTLCSREIDGSSDESYWDGDHGHTCHPCGDNVIAWFNRLIQGHAGYTTSNEVGVPLADLIALHKMTEYQFDMMRLVITEEKRRDVLMRKGNYSI